MTGTMSEVTVHLITPIQDVPGVTRRQVPLFHKLGIRAAAHLLRHLPLRYEYHESEGKISDLHVGTVGAVRGTVAATRVVRHGRKRFEIMLEDESGTLQVVWFNSMFLVNRLHAGMQILVQGKVHKYGSLIQMVNPRWEQVKSEEDTSPAREAEMKPIYSSTEGLSSDVIARIIQKVLDDLCNDLQDHFSDEFRHERDLPPLADAYRAIHRPDIKNGRKEAEKAIRLATRRLAYDELFMLQLSVAIKRYHLRKSLQAPALKHSDAIAKHIRSRFPFELTQYQEKAIREIVKDLTTTIPMNRLLQGDVGSGKTAVALYAMLLAVANRRQAVLMAPTELLAEQHYTSICNLLEGGKVKIGLLTGSLKTAERESLLKDCASGEMDIVIGTHALLTGDVRFHDLALAVTDEQHRFGVEQRAVLRAKSLQEKSKDSPAVVPHVLVMTATPIPRTLSLTIFGDLDVSVIEGMPPGRSPIETRVVSPAEHDKVYDYARERVLAGDQVYVALPAIDESPASGLRAVNSHRAMLEKTYFHDIKVAAVHGKLKAETRERIMNRFRHGDIDVLVATTVIEVGVDVPNATMMIVEHAERFGLAQLHQLRGRIGRGGKKSLCVLVAEPTTQDAQARMEAIASTTDGFIIAEKDLEIRGMGEIIGTRQSGIPEFRVARLPEDMKLLMLAKRDAEKIVRQSPTLDDPADALLKRRLLKLYGETLGLADVG